MRRAHGEFFLKDIKQVRWNVWTSSDLLTVTSIDFFFRDTYLKKLIFIFCGDLGDYLKY